MGRLFQQALQLARDRQALLDNQRLWLVQRNNSCGAVADTAIWSCLLETTKTRASLLEKVIATSTEANQTNQLAPAAAISSPPSRAEAALASASPTPADPLTFRDRKNDRPKDAQLRNEGAITPILIIASFLSLFIAFIVFNIVRHNRRIAAERERAAAEQRHFDSYVQNLVARFGEETATRILAREIWQGMTDEQLVESRGQPSGVGREIIREKTRETWKYHQIGRNRFRERIYLENGIVIGWKH